MKKYQVLKNPITGKYFTNNFEDGWADIDKAHLYDIDQNMDIVVEYISSLRPYYFTDNDPMENVYVLVVETVYWR